MVHLTKRQKDEMTAHSFVRMAIFVVLTVVFAALSVIALIGNSSEAKRRYEALIAADQAGGDVETALNDLRGYIYAHMNTTIGSETGIRPPIQLKGTYDRLVTAEKERVRQINESLQVTAQAECERQNPIDFSGRNRVPCVEEYIDKFGAKEQPIIESLYMFDFASPRWSPDLAGFSVLATIICGLVALIDIALYRRTRYLVRNSR
jgi:hypothetical protein